MYSAVNEGGTGLPKKFGRQQVSKGGKEDSTMASASAETTNVLYGKQAVTEKVINLHPVRIIKSQVVNTAHSASRHIFTLCITSCECSLTFALVLASTQINLTARYHQHFGSLYAYVLGGFAFRNSKKIWGRWRWWWWCRTGCEAGRPCVGHPVRNTEWTQC